MVALRYGGNVQSLHRRKPAAAGRALRALDDPSEDEKDDELGTVIVSTSEAAGPAGLLPAAGPGVVYSIDSLRRSLGTGRPPAQRLSSRPLVADEATPTAALKALARELHDGVLQNLVFLDLEISALTAPVERQSESVSSRLTTLHQVVRESIRDLRGTLGQMHVRQEQPQACMCLQTVLLERIEAFRSMTRAPVMCVMRNCHEPVLSQPSVGHHIDSVVHEALSNAWRHSGAQAITVAFTWEPEGIVIQVSDNGRGFDPATRPEGHFGLRTMEERAATINGRLSLVSAPGRGTTVKLFVPSDSLLETEK